MVVTSRRFEQSNALHFSLSGGCSRDLLDDAVEFEAAIWMLNPESIQRLATALDYLAAHAGRFSVLAPWLDGDRPRSSLHVTRSQLLGLVRGNQIGNNRLYKVGHAG